MCPDHIILKLHAALSFYPFPFPLLSFWLMLVLYLTICCHLSGIYKLHWDCSSHQEETQWSEAVLLHLHMSTLCQGFFFLPSFLSIIFLKPLSWQIDQFLTIKLYLLYNFSMQGSEEDALLEGFRCKNQACDGFLLPDSGWLPVRRKILIEWLWRNSWKLADQPNIYYVEIGELILFDQSLILYVVFIWLYR